MASLGFELALQLQDVVDGAALRRVRCLRAPARARFYLLRALLPKTWADDAAWRTAAHAPSEITGQALTRFEPSIHNDQASSGGNAEDN